MTWSVESIYQFLVANNVYAKKIESAKKTAENRNKKV